MSVHCLVWFTAQGRGCQLLNVRLMVLFHLILSLQDTEPYIDFQMSDILDKSARSL